MNPYLVNTQIEISLTDLVKFLLRKIVWILLAAVVVAGVFGGYRYSRKGVEPVNAPEEEEVYKEALEQYTAESEFFVTMSDKLGDAIADQNDYMKNSLLMSLDPYHLYRSTALVCVRPQKGDENNDETDWIARAEHTILNSVYLDQAAEDLGAAPEYVRELVGVFRPEEHELSSLLTGYLALNPSSGVNSRNCFVIWALEQDEETSALLMDALLKALEEVPADGYEMQVLDRFCMKCAEESVQKAQASAQEYGYKLANMQFFSLPDLAKKLSRPVPPAVSTSRGAELRSAVKYAVFGFLAGAFLAAFMLTLCYILNDRLIDARDAFLKGFRLKDLGTAEEDSMAMAAANIRNCAGDAKKLFLTGMGTEPVFDHAFAQLKAGLSEYELVSAWGALNNAQGREKLLDCDAVVLLEQEKETRYSDMKKEVQFLFNAEKEIIGLVIL